MFRSPRRHLIERRSAYLEERKDPVTKETAAAVVRLVPAGESSGNSCPAWCSEKAAHARPGSYVHRSAARQAPVNRHWWCLDMRDSGDGLSCATSEGIVAFLAMADDDGITEVVLQHGDMELPHVSPRAAEELAGHLLRLAQTAR
jgi:hypothetical protein